jgi:hypothetical protein
MQYPLQLAVRSSLAGLAAQITVSSATGETLMYARPRSLTLKELVEVFADQHCQQQIYAIRADRITFSNHQQRHYGLFTARGACLGKIERPKMKSLWKAHYEISAREKTVFTIEEENRMMQIIATLGTIGLPFLIIIAIVIDLASSRQDNIDLWMIGLGLVSAGMARWWIMSSYQFKPKYLVKRSNGQSVVNLARSSDPQATTFVIKAIDRLSPKEEQQILLSLIVMTLLERRHRAYA